MICKLFVTAIIVSALTGIAQALCVTTPTTNLRAGPGPKHALTWVASKYTPLIEIKRVGGWIQVEDMAGEQQWVYGTNVTSKMVCVSVKTNTAKLRKAPGIKSELADIRQVDKFTPFKRIDINEDWYQVEASGGETYWIHESTVWRPVKMAKVNF